MARFDIRGPGVLRAALLRGAALLLLWLILTLGNRADLPAGLVAAAAATWVSLKLAPPAQARVSLLALTVFVARFLKQSIVAGFDVDSPDVVEPLVAIVQTDEHLARKLLADFLDFRANAVDRRQILGHARLDVGRVEVKVLVAVLVLDVEDVLIVIRPTVARNWADFLFGHRFRFG